MGTIENCYALGTIQGESQIGAFVGLNEGTIRNCYATNEDFQITNRVYDGRKENETREKKVFAAFRRLARALPTSPMLKDTFGHLCPNLEKIDADTAKKIVKWLSLRNRRGVLRPMNEKEG